MRKAREGFSLTPLIDFVLQAHSRGIIQLPSEFWEWPDSRRAAESARLADTIRSDSECADFVREFGHFLPARAKPVAIAPVACRPDWIRPPAAPPVVVAVYRPPRSGASIGLGVNAGLTATALQQAGIAADAMAVSHAGQIGGLLEQEPAIRLVVIEGFWLTPEELAALAESWPAVTFAARCHSQVAFLQVEPQTIARIRGVLEFSRRLPNVKLASNSERFSDWCLEVWGDCWLLPNLYDLSPRAEAKQPTYYHTLRLGSFGALRLQKHHTVAAAAAVAVSRRLGRDVEFFVNTGRDEPGSATVLQAIRNMFCFVRGVRLVESPWQTWTGFRQLVATMDCCFQLSSSETFNLVTADAATAGVPSVVGEAIDWVPADWRATIDDPLAAAKAAMRLLADDSAGQRGRAALEQYCAGALSQWRAMIAIAAEDSCPAETAAANRPA